MAAHNRHCAGFAGGEIVFPRGRSVLHGSFAMTGMQTIGSKWAAYKGPLLALAIGLVVGPFVSNALGWQVTSSKAAALARAGVVQTQAAWCNVAARAAVAAPDKLDWSARLELAKKWAIPPGAKEADTEVTYACERMLQT